MANTGGYRLPVPDPRFLDPNALEGTLAAGLAGGNGNDMVGYAAGANASRRAAGIEYMDMLDQLTKQQDALHRAGMASAERNAMVELAGKVAPVLAEQPDVAQMLGPVYNLLRPEAREYNLNVGVEQRQSSLRQGNARAAKEAGEAGIRMPMGAAVNQYSFAPTVAPRQGVPTSVMAAGAGNSGTGGAPRYTVAVDPNSGQLTVQGAGADPTAVVDGTLSAQRLLAERGGRAVPGAGGAGGATRALSTAEMSAIETLRRQRGVQGVSAPRSENGKVLVTVQTAAGPKVIDITNGRLARQ